MRRFGQRPQPELTYKPRPGAYAILVRDQEVLLTFQDEPFFEFQLPGGGIDPGETPIRALHREVMEETGWRIEVVRRLGAYRRFVYMPDYDIEAEKICHIYLARPSRQICEPTEEGHYCHWVSREQAKEYVKGEGDAYFLRQYIG